MKKIYVVLIGIVVFVLIGSALRIAIPENPNFNYITLDVTAQIDETDNNSSTITFYVNATGFTHAFCIESCEPFNLPVHGFNLLFVSQNSSNKARIMAAKYLDIIQNGSGWQLISNTSTPALNISGNHSNVNEKVSFNNLKSGYYFYYLGDYKTSGPGRDIITVKYDDFKSTCNILNLTALGKM